MTCYRPLPKFAKPIDAGIVRVWPYGNGSSIALTYRPAYSTDTDYLVGYNIYYSTSRNDVFKEGVKYFSKNTDVKVNVFTPGDMTYFAVRATLYNPLDIDLTQLPTSDTIIDGYFYPDSILASNISDIDTQIPLVDATGFPSSGVIKVGAELIKYYWINYITNIVSTTPTGRGFLGTSITAHAVNGSDGYVVRDPIVRVWSGFEDPNEMVMECEPQFQPPDYAFTVTDGYRQTPKDLLTTDLGGSDESNINNPSYDYSGYHQTSITDFFSGKCIGSYHGGEYGCADGYGPNHIKVRGLNLQVSNMQRQEMLLNVTGEPVVLLRRLWTGVRCNCFRYNNEAPEGRCHVCFKPGTLIRTDRGYLPIETINIGDKVLSSDGEFHKVTQTMCNPFDGYLVSILSSINSKPILSTPTHPFLTVGGSHLVKDGCGPTCDKFIAMGDGVLSFPPDVRQLPSGMWHTRVTINQKRYTLGSFLTREEAVEKINQHKIEKIPAGHDFIWTDACSLTEQSWLVSKQPNLIKDINTINIPNEYLKNTKLGIKRNGVSSFECSEEFMWIIGIYIAEGSCSKRHVCFSLHRNEIEFQNRIKTFFESFGYTTNTRKTSENGVDIYVYSTTLAEWFPNWIGKKCFIKKIPEELMYLPISKTKALIKGIYDGDGSKERNEIVQTSEILALQLVEILGRIGEQPLLRAYYSKFLTPNGNKRKLAYCVSWALDTLVNNNRKNRWDFKDESLTKIRKINNEYYNGSVYNLEVEGDHTYVVNGIVVHNCLGTGFVGGYQQYYNSRRSDGRILIRVEPTTDDLKYADKGLEQNFSPNAWTVVVPAIKDRDVLIRFNEDQTDEFRYEVINVTRNKLLFSLSGAQKMNLRRLDKTDIIYQYRSFRDTSKFPTKIFTTITNVPGLGPHMHEITINENITALSQINQTTGVAAGHVHSVINGVLSNGELNHTHSIIL